MPAKQVPIIVINGLLALLLLYYASIQVPVAGLLIGALMPLPTILTIRRAGWLAGLLLVAAGVGMMYYVEHFSGIKAEVLPFLHMAVIGFAVSFLASRQYRLEVIVGGTVVLAVSLQVGVFLILAWQQGLTPLAYLQHMVGEVWTAFSQLIEKEQLLEQEFPLSRSQPSRGHHPYCAINPGFAADQHYLGSLAELSAQSATWEDNAAGRTPSCPWLVGKLPVG